MFLRLEDNQVKLFKRNGFWHCEFKDATRRLRFSSGITLSEPRETAERAASEKLRKLLTGTGGAPQAARSVGKVFNLAEALERTLNNHWAGTPSEGQIKFVVRRLEREIGHWLLTEIDYRKLKEYADGCIKQGKKPATVNRRMSAMKVALRDACRMGDLTAMPMFPSQLPENNIRERYLSAEEEQRVQAYLGKRVAVELIEGGDDWQYLANLFVFLIDTGCRLGEALKLPDCDGRVAHLKTGTTKSGRARVVPLTARAGAAMVAMLASPLHGKVDDNFIGRRWGRVRVECDIRDVNIHILRHTCASRLLAAKVDLYTVSKWLGHSSVKVTERYGHLAHGALEQALAALVRSPVAVTPLVDVSVGTQPVHL
jgi:integrase